MVQSSPLMTRPPTKYLLLDANVLAAYYAPQTLRSSLAAAGPRIQIIIDSVRKGCSPEVRLLTPEICVAEAQTVLSKHANPKWKKPGRKRDDPQAIHGKSYKSITKEFFEDLHGARLIESVPLQRYHVLAKHLITPIDHSYRIQNPNGGKPLGDLGGTDQLICGMAICLTRLLGSSRLVVITTDYRMAKVLDRARTIDDTKLTELGIPEFAESRIGFEWTRDVFPNVVDLARADDKRLRKALGVWPLPTKKVKLSGAAKPLTLKQIDTLIALYRAIGIARDRLPYSTELARLTRDFNNATGRNCSEPEVWISLLARLKQGGVSLRNP